MSDILAEMDRLNTITDTFWNKKMDVHEKTEMSMVRLALVSFFGAAGVFAVLLAVVFATGATFGQRCAKAYTSPPDIERCVERLNSGGPVYQG